MSEWTEGVYGDCAVIIRNGQPVSIFRGAESAQRV